MKFLTLILAAALLYSTAVYAQDDDFTGYATASISSGQVDIRTFGFRNADRNLPYDSTTIQPVGSVSKTVIGIAILKAVEMGLLSLDTDIKTYLDFSVKNPQLAGHRPITLRDLATHTSGIRDREKAYQEAYTDGINQAKSLEDYLRSYFIPGAKRNEDHH